MHAHSPKRLAFEQFALLARALGNGHRLELLDILVQGERGVERIAQAAGLTVNNTSQHLQQLRRAGLVTNRKTGTQVIYALADPEVLTLVRALWRVGERNLAELKQVMQHYYRDRDTLEPVSRDELRARLRKKSVIVIDVRPVDEYAAGHIPGARSIPSSELKRRLKEVPRGREIVACCRGPYCVYSYEAVEISHIHSTWEKDPARVKEIGDSVYATLSRVHDSVSKAASVATVVPTKWLATARDQMLRRRDTLSGGFEGGGGTRFPQSPVLGLLLTDYRVNGTPESLQTVAETLNAIVYGGIHDHLAGGVHRYSTEPTWSVPHFEKMLYDNAQLLGLYADLFAIARQPLARAMAADIAGYLMGHMMSPDGAFYTAEDAEVGGKEGESYVWSRAEITQALGAADAERFFAVYELTPLPTEPAGPGVIRIRLNRAATIKDRLQLGRELEALAPLRAKLLAVRDRRKQPLRDDKIVAALNGLAIAALARAGTVFGEPAWVVSAKRCGS